MGQSQKWNFNRPNMPLHTVKVTFTRRFWNSNKTDVDTEENGNSLDFNFYLITRCYGRWEWASRLYTFHLWKMTLHFCEQQIHWMCMALPFVFEMTTRICLSAWHHQQCALYLGEPVCFCFVFPFEPNFSFNPKVPTLILMHSATCTVFVCLSWRIPTVKSVLFLA